MKVTQDVLDVLDRCRADGNGLFLPDEQLDRKLYTRVNAVLEAAGGQWSRKYRAHLFPDSAADAMEQILLSGEVATRQDFGFFPTPAAVVERLLELAALEPGHRVLEPSAGAGAIAVPVLGRGCIVDCVEIQEDLARGLRETLPPACSVHGGDFLLVAPSAVYDRVIMNPPFGKGQDVRHVEHALRFLVPGGLLVAVMSAGVTFREGKAFAGFRAMVAERGGATETLDPGAFRESGTNVSTVIVTVSAPLAREAEAA